MSGRTTLPIAVACALALVLGCGARPGAAAVGARRPKAPPIRRIPRGSDPFEGDFHARLAAADPARRFVALVDLSEQLDLYAFARRGGIGSMIKAERREAVIAALEAVARRQQSRLGALLSSLRAEGSLTDAQPVAIVNRVIVEGTAAALFALARSPEVAAIRPDWTSERPEGCALPAATPAGREPDEAFRSWAVDAMKADRLWSQGLDGRGIVVASIDTGAFEAHEQLRLRRVPGERGWFDPVERTTLATDRHGHGTGVLSQAVGGNPDGRVCGIAPGARWAAALGNWRNFYARSRMTLAADWVLRVARPDVLVNAWSHDEGACNDFDRPLIDAWRASGIFVVFPAGNGGPEPGTGESPAQLRGLFPDGGAVFSVAALAAGGAPHRTSSRGPSRCGSHGFPTLAAPGDELPMASPGGPNAYVRGEGTSLSAGLVGGGAALLLQAAPETDPATLERVMVESARDVGAPGRDDAAGAGAVDLEAALALLRAATPR